MCCCCCFTETTVEVLNYSPTHRPLSSCLNQKPHSPIWRSLEQLAGLHCVAAGGFKVVIKRMHVYLFQPFTAIYIFKTLKRYVRESPYLPVRPVPVRFLCLCRKSQSSGQSGRAPCPIPRRPHSSRTRCAALSAPSAPSNTSRGERGRYLPAR